MVQKKDGMNYAPSGKINHVVEPGEFNVGVTALDHGHINGMTNGLIEAGASIIICTAIGQALYRFFFKKHPMDVSIKNA